MKIGILKEIKNKEFRVSATPGLVAEIVKKGHEVFVENNAGLGIGFLNENYINANAKIFDSAKEIFDKSDIILKVKELQKEEILMLREGQIVFTYLHLASDKDLTKGLLDSKATCFAYETITNARKELPLLKPMSEIAGRLSVQIGARYLENTNGGKGILLGGVPGVERAKVTIIGAGVVGYNAALIALGMGADVYVLDNNIKKLEKIENFFNRKVKTVFSNSENIEKHLQNSDLCIGSVLIAGASAPKLITKSMIKKMKKKSVLIDVAIDQGGCFETSEPTTHDNPIFYIDDIIHYCVTNIPGCVARSSTIALTNSTAPYILELAENQLNVVKKNKYFKEGLNIFDGKITYKPVADSLNFDYHPYP